MRIPGEKQNTEALGPDVANTIHAAFEHQPNQHPSDIAVVFHGRPVSYGELNTMAKKMAGKLSVGTADSGTLVESLLGSS